MFPFFCRVSIRFIVFLYGEHLFKMSLGQILMADDGARSVEGVEITVRVSGGDDDESGASVTEAIGFAFNEVCELDDDDDETEDDGDHDNKRRNRHKRRTV